MVTASTSEKCHFRNIVSRGIRPRKRLTALMIAISTVSLLAAQVALPAAGQASTVSVGAKAAKVAAANKALVLSFNDQLFNQGNLAVIDADTAPTYTEHNPTVADGQAGLRNLVLFLQMVAPNSHTYVKRAIAEGDLVLLQSNAIAVPGTAGQSIIDIFRVANGKIVEHWDNLEDVPATTVNGHDLFSTLSNPQTSDPDPRASTKDSRNLVLNYFSALTRRHDLSAVNRFVARNLYQHDPAIADGAAATRKYYADIYRANPQATFTVARVIAEGDLVAIHSHFQKSPSDLGQSVVDIYRVRHHAIVEHWDGIQDVPATSVNGNGMF